MPKFHDLGTRNSSEEFTAKAEELGWDTTAANYDIERLDGTDWGELKKDIQRSNSDILIYEGGDGELHRKVAEHGKVDVIMSPDEGRKDSGIDHVIAKECAENDIAIGFEMRRLFTSEKQRSHILKHWRRNLKLCEKYDAMKLLTTGAEELNQLRAPQDTASLIESLGFKGKEAISDHPQNIIEEVRR